MASQSAIRQTHIRGSSTISQHPVGHHGSSPYRGRYDARLVHVFHGSDITPLSTFGGLTGANLVLQDLVGPVTTVTHKPMATPANTLSEMAFSWHAI